MSGFVVGLYWEASAYWREQLDYKHINFSNFLYSVMPPLKRHAGQLNYLRRRRKDFFLDKFIFAFFATTFSFARIFVLRGRLK